MFGVAFWFKWLSVCGVAALMRLVVCLNLVFDVLCGGFGAGVGFTSVYLG